MDTKPVSLNKNAFNTAVLVGLALIALSILFYVFDVKPRSPWNYVVYLVMIGGMIWGTLNLRDKHRNGVLPYGQAFLSSFLIGTYGGIISSVFAFIFYKWIAPEQIGKLLDMAMEQMETRFPQFTDEQIDAAMKMQEKFMTPIGISVMSFLSMVVASLIIALLIGIFLKKNSAAQQIFSNTEE